VGERLLGKMKESRFVPLAAALLAEAEIGLSNEGGAWYLSELEVRKLQGELGSITANLGGWTQRWNLLLAMKIKIAHGGALWSAIGYLVDRLGFTLEGKGVHKNLYQFFALPVEAAVEQAYKTIQILDLRRASTEDIENACLDAALRFIKGEGETDFFQLAVHLEVIRVHREGLLEP
jgi:hypothetical protein